MTISSCVSQLSNIFLVFPMIPIPKITPEMQEALFCNSYDSYIEKATRIIKESQSHGLMESWNDKLIRDGLGNLMELREIKFGIYGQAGYRE